MHEVYELLSGKDESKNADQSDSASMSSVAISNRKTNAKSGM